MESLSDQTRSIDQMLPDFRRAASIYSMLVKHGHTYLDCENGVRYEILWECNRFRHLTGLEFYRKDKSGGKSYQEPARRFFDDMLKGKFKEVDIRYREGRKLASDKSRVICDALMFRNATHVVQSTNSAIIVYFGGTEWALGLVHDESGLRYRPASLRQQSVFDKDVLKPNTRPLRILHIIS